MGWLFAVSTMLASPLFLLGIALYESFRLRRTHPVRALRLLIDAMDIVRPYMLDADYEPTEEEVAIFCLLQRSLAYNAAMLGRSVDEMQQR